MRGRSGAGTRAVLGRRSAAERGASSGVRRACGHGGSVRRAQGVHAERGAEAAAGASDALRACREVPWPCACLPRRPLPACPFEPWLASCLHPRHARAVACSLRAAAPRRRCSLLLPSALAAAAAALLPLACALAPSPSATPAPLCPTLPSPLSQIHFLPRPARTVYRAALSLSPLALQLVSRTTLTHTHFAHPSSTHTSPLLCLPHTRSSVRTRCLGPARRPPLLVCQSRPSGRLALPLFVPRSVSPPPTDPCLISLASHV
jgi:hypothetical protein